jgi:hypothetical protein
MKTLNKIKELWAKFIVLANKKAFVFGYPIGAIALLSLIKGSLLGVLLLAVWLIAIIVNKDEI